MRGLRPVIGFLLFLASLCGAATVTLTSNAGKWTLKLDGAPYIIKGMNYDVVKVCENNSYNWKTRDDNANSKLDGPHDAWIDRDEDNLQDGSEMSEGDFQILRNMGCNSIRDYLNGNDGTYDDWKPFYRAMFTNYGIRVIMGEFLGAYGVALGHAANYASSADRAALLKSVTNIVKFYKDEPYILMWVLGNENNYTFSAPGVAANPTAYAQFVEIVAQRIHQLDPDHPVALCNGDVGYLSYYAANAPSVDIFAVNSYRGSGGFGTLWTEVKSEYNKPVLVTEYGGPWESAWSGGVLGPSFQQDQVTWHSNCWTDIVQNSYYGTGAGNSIGGIPAQYLDRWWEHGGACSQDSGDNGGIFSQGNGSASPYMRGHRKVHTYYTHAWGGLITGITFDLSPGVTVSTCQLSVNVTAWTQVTGASLISISPTGMTSHLALSGSGSNYSAFLVISNAFPNGFQRLVFSFMDGTNQAYSVFQYLVDTLPPSVPSGLSVYEDSTGAMSLSWLAVSDLTSGVGSYGIYRSSDGGASWALLGSSMGTSYLDTGAVAGEGYLYRISSVDQAGNESMPSGVVEGRRTADRYQIWPVPVKFPVSTVKLGLNLEEDSIVSIDICDISGQCLKKLINGISYTKGWIVLEWNGRDEQDSLVRHGLYYCRIRLAGKGSVIRKIVVE